MALLLALLCQADLIDKLRADDIAVREAAERELLKMGESVLPALKKALEGEKEAEAKARLERLIGRIDRATRYGRDRKDWRVRFAVKSADAVPRRLPDHGIHPDDDKADERPRFVELRADGSGVAVRPDGVWVLAPTRKQLDALFEGVMGAELLEREYDLSDRERWSRLVNEQEELTFVTGREKRELTWRERDRLGADLAGVARTMRRALADPREWGGRPLESLVDALAGREAEGVEKELRVAGPVIAEYLIEARESADEAVRARIDRLLKEFAK